MSKRPGTSINGNGTSSSKRPKLEVPKPPSNESKKSSKEEDEDLWGEDFPEEDLEQIELIASQACSQDVNVSTVNINHREDRNVVKYGILGPIASTSTGITNTIKQRNGSRLRDNFEQPPAKLQRYNSWRPQASQTLGSSEFTRQVQDLPTIDEFKSSLISKSNLNSTFQMQQSQIGRVDNEVESKIQSLTGELIYWKDKMEKYKQQIEKENSEKEKAAQEKQRALEARIAAVVKEKDNYKTQYELQTLQVGNLMEKMKLLENQSVKLVQPSTSTLNSPKLKADRAVSMAKAVRSENCVQVDTVKQKIDDKLKTVVHQCPLQDIPARAFEAPLPEKPVVDVKVVEKIGQKNLPILQEEESFRIFENPDLVKPVVTMVDGRPLDTVFLWGGVATMMKKTTAEIDSKESISVINKIVATTRELLLNTIVVLKKIATAIKDDDIRDMNDFYLSEYYDQKLDYSQTVFDSQPWYQQERGVETRRAVAILAHFSKASNYLSEYIAGKATLITKSDKEYENYSVQMERFNAWEKKGHDYEILEMILEFVKTLLFIRRSHQFSGLITAILMLLCNVQKQVGFTTRGVKYVAEIFKEIILARPFFICFVPLIDVFICFVEFPAFNVKLCPSVSEKSGIETGKDYQYFKNNSCLLAVFMAQLMTFEIDEIMTIQLSHSMLSLVNRGFLLYNISWPAETDVHNCRVSILSFTIKILYMCSKINVTSMRKRLTDQPDGQIAKKLDADFWDKLQHRQFDALRSGIAFFSFLAKREPEIIARAPDADDLFQLFIQQVTAVDGFSLHESENEALYLIKASIALDSPSFGESSRSSTEMFSTRDAIKIPRFKARPSIEKFRQDYNKSRLRNIVKK